MSSLSNGVPVLSFFSTYLLNCLMRSLIQLSALSLDSAGLAAGAGVVLGAAGGLTTAAWTFPSGLGRGGDAVGVVSGPTFFPTGGGGGGAIGRAGWAFFGLGVGGVGPLGVGSGDVAGVPSGFSGCARQAINSKTAGTAAFHDPYVCFSFFSQMRRLSPCTHPSPTK